MLREESEIALQTSFIGMLFSSCGLHYDVLISSPKPPLPNTFTLELRISTYEFCRVTNIWSTTITINTIQRKK
jgi:hypothetical protein